MNIIIYLAEKLDKKKRSVLCSMTERSFRMDAARVTYPVSDAGSPSLTIRRW